MDSKDRKHLPNGVARTLEITSGLHAGARARLPGHAAVIVGSAEDCDVCLADAKVAPHHLLLVAAGDGLVARAVDGDVVCDGRALKPGTQRRVADGRALLLLPAGVGLRLRTALAAKPSAPPKGAHARLRQGGFATLALATLVAVVAMAQGNAPRAESPEVDRRAGRGHHLPAPHRPRTPAGTGAPIPATARCAPGSACS